MFFSFIVFILLLLYTVRVSKYKYGEVIALEQTDNTVSVITEIEWEMFESVNEGGPRADCQEDRETFMAMRRAQFYAWPENVRESYLDDLILAVAQGRNLIAEKYIHITDLIKITLAYYKPYKAVGRGLGKLIQAFKRHIRMPYEL